MSHYLNANANANVIYICLVHTFVCDVVDAGNVVNTAQKKLIKSH